MTWKPTEGMTRADYIVRELAENGEAAQNIIGPILQHRMRDVIAKHIDRALEEGFALAKAAQPALDLGPEEPPVSAYETVGGGIDFTVQYWPADKPLPSQGLAGDAFTHLQLPAAVNDTLQGVVDAAVDLGQQIEKRKRGRPKGSVKKAKPGRKPKAAPVEEAVAEAIAEGGS